MPPLVSISPTGEHMLLLETIRHLPIAELAQPMLRLAGLRINPRNNGPHRWPCLVSLKLKRTGDEGEVCLMLPHNARVGYPLWSPDGKRFAFTNTTTGDTELWVGESATGHVHRLEGLRLNTAYGAPFDWMPDNRTLLVGLVPDHRGDPPVAPLAPVGPNVQESKGHATPVRTHQNLLQNAYDETLFDYYTTSQLALVGVSGGKAATIGQPAVYPLVEPSPDGKHFLVARLKRPYSYLHPCSAFPREIEVWDHAARVVFRLASRPLADHVPLDGVPVGPRAYRWKPTEAATLVWAEALDGGDPKRKVAHRDRVLLLRAPFRGSPVEILRTEHRFDGIRWAEGDEFALVNEYDRDTRWRRTYLLNVKQPDAAPPQIIWSRSSQDRYNSPGMPLSHTLPSGHCVLLRHADWIYLAGEGATPEGDRPFLDRFNLRTLQSERIFRSDAESHESVVALLDDQAGRLITCRESQTEPPNYYVRERITTAHHCAAGRAGAQKHSDEMGIKHALTRFPDLQPQLRGIQKQFVTYHRDDGVELSMTLYLPPGYRQGMRLPTVFWSYPVEFNHARIAGQVTASTNRFTAIGGPSHLFFLLAGYAILDKASVPIIGAAETVNDDCIDQIVRGARAAVIKAVGMGITDPERVGVGGHSYGAFMTASLLAHTDLFRAAIALSGAYNRTLTPFGFQNERRTLWEAPEAYARLSPLLDAHRIRAPLLLIHGEADDNIGTFPIQSERMYQAIRGNGGTARLVMLPHEGHTYAARESVEHALYEMIAWFDKYVKNARNL